MLWLESHAQLPYLERFARFCFTLAPSSAAAERFIRIHLVQDEFTTTGSETSWHMPKTTRRKSHWRWNSSNISTMRGKWRQIRAKIATERHHFDHGSQYFASSGSTANTLVPALEDRIGKWEKLQNQSKQAQTFTGEELLAYYNMTNTPENLFDKVYAVIAI